MIDRRETSAGIPARQHSDCIEDDRHRWLATDQPPEVEPVSRLDGIARVELQLKSAEVEAAPESGERRHAEQRWQREVHNRPRRRNIPDQKIADANQWNDDFVVTEPGAAQRHPLVDSSDRELTCRVEQRHSASSCAGVQPEACGFVTYRAGPS